MLANVRLASVLFVVSILCLAKGAALVAGDWPTFRGADRTATSKDTGLLTKWPANGPPLVWKATAPAGYASLAVAGKHVFTLGDGPSTASDSNEYLSCFDRSSGKLIWQKKTGNPWKSGQPTWQSLRPRRPPSMAIAFTSSRRSDN